MEGNETNSIWEQIFPWFLTLTTVAMTWFLPDLQEIQVAEDIDSISTFPLNQAIAAFVFLIGSLVWGIWIGKKLVVWIADFIVDFIFSVHGSSSLPQSPPPKKSPHIKR